MGLNPVAHGGDGIPQHGELGLELVLQQGNSVSGTWSSGSQSPTGGLRVFMRSIQLTKWGRGAA